MVAPESPYNLSPACLVTEFLPQVRFPHHIVDGGIVFKNACALGCEGIVSKRLGSTYRSGRSRHWLKVKNPNITGGEGG
jgi:ATP-dependent DNA ligase